LHSIKKNHGGEAPFLKGGWEGYVLGISQENGGIQRTDLKKGCDRRKVTLRMLGEGDVLGILSHSRTNREISRTKEKRPGQCLHSLLGFGGEKKIPFRLR